MTSHRLLRAAQAPATAAAPATQQILGYFEAHPSHERIWEKKFSEALSADNIRENLRRLSARPHHVGSPYDKDNAEWILARFKQWGFDAHLEIFDVLFPTPKVRVLEMLEPRVFHAVLQEPAIAGDGTSNQSGEQLPTYNAYSADGDVTARLVYVNYGDREDYEELDRLGISVRGAIVIARYGKGDVYPEGGWRPGDGVQRGSVMDTDYPGDPLTPGIGATPRAKRLKLSEAKTITRIPVMPISANDALPLLSALAGPVAPAAWRGALYGNERGYFEAGGTQDLQTFISEVAHGVNDPETGTSVYVRARLRAISKAHDAQERAEIRSRNDLEVTALGDGSDYTAFQDFAGIPSLDLSFGGEDDGDQYHSIYDDFAWYSKFVDPDFAYGRALAEAAGTAIMRLADADLLPYDYAPQSDAIAKYVEELEKLLKDRQDEYRERALQRKEGVFDATRDPRWRTPSLRSSRARIITARRFSM